MKEIIMTISITSILEAELPSLRECNVRNLPVFYQLSDYKEMFRDPRTIILIAKDEAQIVGYVIGTLETNKQFHIISFTVDKNHRRHGIGTMLMKEIEKKSHKYQSVMYTTLNVDVNNHDAIQFYIRYGFKKIMVMNHYYGLFQNGYKLGKRIRIK